MIILVDGHQTQPEYVPFLAQTIDGLRDKDVTGLALVALTENGAGVSYTAYWQMDTVDKLRATDEIRFDALDAFLRANGHRYWPQRPTDEKPDEDEDPDAHEPQGS